MAANVDVKARVAELLLPELKNGVEEWYYISIADEKEFYGGYLVKGYGFTDAWCKVHNLNWFPRGGRHSTETTGPISEETMAKIPTSQRWRRLNKEEAENLGK